MKDVKARNIAAVSLVLAVLYPTFVSAQTGIEEEIKTKGYLNGRGIMKFMSCGENGMCYATQFITGALEGMTAINGGMTIREIYPDCRKADIIKAVIEYYMKNPSKQHRPVVDVILSGCK